MVLYVLASVATTLKQEPGVNPQQEMTERFDPTIHSAVDKYYNPSVGDFCATNQMHWYIKAVCLHFLLSKALT
jgi:hypothetical protein